MRSLLLTFLLLSACGAPAPAPEGNEAADLPVPSGPPVVQQVDRKAPEAVGETQPRWESATGATGTALRLIGKGGATEMSMMCLAGPKRLVVNVPGFSAIGSEDRFALALGEEPLTLVADPMRQKQGVTAEGPAPADFNDLLTGAETIGAMYGNQKIGPHPAPAKSLLEALAKECGA